MFYPFLFQYHMTLNLGKVDFQLSVKRLSTLPSSQILPGSCSLAGSTSVLPAGEAFVSPAAQHQSCFILHQEVLVSQPASKLRCQDGSLESTSISENIAEPASLEA